MKEPLHFLNRIQKVITDKWDQVGMSDFQGRDFTYREIATRMIKLHLMYERLGIADGQKIALSGKNSANWGMTFLSILSDHKVAVPILVGFKPDSLTGLVNHSESVLFFTEDKTAAQVKTDAAPMLKAIISIDTFKCIWAREDSLREVIDGTDEAFESKYPTGITREDVNFHSDDLDNLMIINYTSGTTGDPKGIMLNGRSISTNVQFGIEFIPVKYTDTSISMLPLAHMYGLTFEFVYTFAGGSHVYFVGKALSPSLLMKVFADVRPYILITVPLVMEKIIKGKVIPTLEKPAIRRITRIPVLGKAFYRIVGKKVLKALGGNVRMIPIGGAPLNRRVEEVMKLIGLPYAVGYGMTECGPLAAWVNSGDHAFGSCGRAMAEYEEVRIDSFKPDTIPGEIQIRGKQVMMGYFHNPEAEKEAFTEDGWLRTGDLGVMDQDGNIFIKGRSKCMILSANGQNIYPEEIEHLVNNLPGISESVVVGRGKDNILVALITLNGEYLKQLPEDTTVEQLLADNLITLNAQLPAYSKISKFEIVEGGFEHTPKQSIKRNLYS